MYLSIHIFTSQLVSFIPMSHHGFGYIAFRLSVLVYYPVDINNDM